MFSAFKRSSHQISIFHNHSSPPSIKALALLQAALSSPYPPNTASRSPLKFDLEVIEHPPTADQIRTILSYLPAPASTHKQDNVASFISSHPSAPELPERPHSPEGLVRLAERSPNALKWPVVVDWTGGRAVVGEVEGVTQILEILRQKRDGELQEGNDEYSPKGWFS
ncbi:thioredoxin-like protein [Amylostereum chailletii]|nr:thioredoxin-like protein [Amylostereum chailletii]